MAQARHMEDLETLLGGVVEEFGLILDSVIEAREGGVPVARVVVEEPEGSEGGVDADVLADVSRAVSKILDDNDPFDTEYMLEVSTPGAERELTKPRHWRKEIGHLIRVKLRDGSACEGRLLTVEDDHAILDVESPSPASSLKNQKEAKQVSTPTSSQTCPAQSQQSWTTTTHSTPNTCLKYPHQVPNENSPNPATGAKKSATSSA